MWRENLFNNLIVVIVLGSLAAIVYCKVKKQTIGEVIKDIRDGMKGEE
jgi:uncharacterized membrane protein